jgi:aldose 1-epimerase
LSGVRGQFNADVKFDRDLEATVVELEYVDSSDLARSMSVAIAPDLGSNMYQFRVGRFDVIHCDASLLRERAFTGNFVLWPFPNRMTNRRYVYQGVEYSLRDIKRPEDDEVLIHGLVFDQPWQHDSPKVLADSVAVTTWYDMTPDSPQFAAFPFESRLSLTYTLRSNGVRVEYGVRNLGSGTMPYGFALHPYFSAPGGGDNVSVTIPATTVMEADDKLLPTGRVLNVDSVMYAMFDLRQPRALGCLNLDHVYTGLLPGAPCAIAYKDQALRVNVSASAEFTHIVIYAPPGTPYFCLENQTCATDAINLHHGGLQDLAHLLEVRPGDAQSGHIDYAVVFDREAASD